MAREQKSEQIYITIKSAAEHCNILHILSKVNAEKMAKDEGKNIIFHDSKSETTYVCGPGGNSINVSNMQIPSGNKRQMLSCFEDFLVDVRLDPEDKFIENNRSLELKIIASIKAMIKKYSHGSESQQAKGRAINEALNAAIEKHSDFTMLGKPLSGLVSDSEHALWKLETAMQQRVGFGASLKSGDSKAYKEVLQIIKDTYSPESNKILSSLYEKS